MRKWLIAIGTLVSYALLQNPPLGNLEANKYFMMDCLVEYKQMVEDAGQCKMLTSMLNLFKELDAIFNDPKGQGRPSKSKEDWHCVFLTSDVDDSASSPSILASEPEPKMQKFPEIIERKILNFLEGLKVVPSAGGSSSSANAAILEDTIILDSRLSLPFTDLTTTSSMKNGGVRFHFHDIAFHIPIITSGDGQGKKMTCFECIR